MRKASRLAGFMLVLALGVMAFAANVANAESTAFWEVNKTKVINNTLKPQVQITALETLPATGIQEGILLTKTGLTTVEVHCTEMKLENAALLEKGGAEGEIHFSGCTTKLNKGATAAVCKPHSLGAPEGFIETDPLKGLIVLHEPKAGEKIDLVELKPASGTVFVTLVFGPEVGSECSIKKFDLTGKTFVKAITAEEKLLENTLTHLFQEGPLSALLFGGNAATVDGSARARLVVEPHFKGTWSGQPG